jgi:hypothetical protein
LTFLEAIAVIAGLASVRESIKQRGGHLGIAEHGLHSPKDKLVVTISEARS